MTSKEGNTIYQRRVATSKDFRIKQSWAENMSDYEVKELSALFRKKDYKSEWMIDLRGWSDLGNFDVGIDPPNFFFTYLRKFHQPLMDNNVEFFIENLNDYPSLYMMRSLLKYLEGFVKLRTAALNIGKRL